MKTIGVTETVNHRMVGAIYRRRSGNVDPSAFENLEAQRFAIVDDRGVLTMNTRDLQELQTQPINPERR